jgi:perosamine synthetase
MTIPLFKPTLHGTEETEAVCRVLDSGWWALGPETEKFEEEFAAYTGTRYAVALNSGTMALKLAAKATGLVDGLVICPALTFISTALAMQQLGNRVVFADVAESDLTINWYDALLKFSAYRHLSGPRGIVPVWYTGRVNDITVDYTSLPSGTRIIEDCAHAAGSVRAGQIGRVAAWSFHAVKNLATGDGGMITTDDEHIAKEVRKLRWLGIDKSTWDRDKNSKVGYGWDYNITTDEGEKAHMNDLSAAIGRVQLKHLTEDNSKRRIIAQVYSDNFGGLDWFRRPIIKATDSAHMYVARVPALERDRFIAHMIEQGVSAGVHYKPLTHYSDRKGRPLFGDQAVLTTTEAAWQQLVTLPLYPTMNQDEIERVVTAVKGFAI